MREPRRNFFDHAEELAGPPSAGVIPAWIAGIILPLLVICFGLYCIFTGEVKSLHMTFGAGSNSIHSVKILQGTAATALGLTICFTAAFAHSHWFWGNHPKLSRYYEPAKLIALIGLVPSLAWFLYSIVG